MVPHQLSLDAAVPVRESEAAVPLLESERFDTVVVAAKTSTSDGFEPTDVAWLLESSPAEVLVLRPGAAASQLQA